jgi:hypothetical protein
MYFIQKINDLLLRILIVWLAALPATQAAEEPRQWSETHLDELLSFYREFHSQPELSFREVNTAARLAAALQDCGVEVARNAWMHTRKPENVHLRCTRRCFTLMRKRR